MAGLTSPKAIHNIAQGIALGNPGTIRVAKGDEQTTDI